MSVLLSRGTDSANGKGRTPVDNKEKSNSPLLVARRRDKSALLRQRDTVRIVNETSVNNQDEVCCKFKYNFILTLLVWV